MDVYYIIVLFILLLYTYNQVRFLSKVAPSQKYMAEFLCI